MSLTSSEKNAVIKKYGLKDNDTGSTEVQIALLTSDINKLTDHFKSHVKDVHSRQGLIRKVNLRRKLLGYLKKTNVEKFRQLVKELNIRG